MNAGDFQSIASIIEALKYCYLVALVKNELLVLPALPSKQLARLGRGPSKDSPFPRSMAALVIPPLLSSVRPSHHHHTLSSVLHINKVPSVAAMPPHTRVSEATRAAINCSEMDAQLAALHSRAQPSLRIASSDRSSARFLSRSSVSVKPRIESDQ